MEMHFSCWKFLTCMIKLERSHMVVQQKINIPSLVKQGLEYQKLTTNGSSYRFSKSTGAPQKTRHTCALLRLPTMSRGVILPPDKVA